MSLVSDTNSCVSNWPILTIKSTKNAQFLLKPTGILLPIDLENGELCENNEKEGFIDDSIGTA
jgi:hypothetical protein